ncbi:MAG TPA: alpha/beta hydrolase-fold protein [Terriglobales bacterium]|nr:alpha/beta hydrolase-fold protein [Terriglobales bacterium]
MSQLTQMAKTRSPELATAIRETFDAKTLTEGTAWAGRGADFFFAVEVEENRHPVLILDEERHTEMQQIAGTRLWYASVRLEPLGKLHSFYYRLTPSDLYAIGGARFGGSLDLPAYAPDSYQQRGVPVGNLSEKIVHTSKIYDGMKSEAWVYVPAQYDPKKPAALMVFQDGGWYIDREGSIKAINVIDNLIAQEKIPVMIAVFINPGDISESSGTPTYEFVSARVKKWNTTSKNAMRSTLYDTVSDRYVRFLTTEVLAEVEGKYNIRKDAYSRAITGLSSGGICSFNAAWQAPGQFSRVITWIGSFASIQWKEDPKVPDGGQDYPDKILREPKRNIRVWMQDGANDLEQENFGSWPLANLRMANALKSKGYDFHLSFGKGTHNSAHGAAEFPEEMIWLWRNYDPAKTEQTYEMESSEKMKPLFRVGVVNR